VRRRAETGWRLRVVAVAVPVTLLIVATWYDHMVVATRADEIAHAISSTLAEHASKVMDTGDLVLARVLDRVRGMDWATIGTSSEAHEFLDRLVEELPQVESVFLVDPEGRASASSRGFPTPRYDASAREYFTAAKSGWTGLFVSAPFRSRSTGAIGFTLSRARLRDGAFDGIAGVTFSVSYFDSVWQDVLRRDGSSAFLIRDDGTVLLGYPPPADATPQHADGLLVDQIRRGGDGRPFEGRSALDGRSKIVAVSRVQGEPLFAAYEADTWTALAGWRVHAATFAMFATIGVLALLWSAHTTLRHAERERESMRQLVVEAERRREAEAMLNQSRRLDALGRVASSVAHDFNNLLTIVLNTLQIMSKTVTDAQQHRLIATATQASERGARLTSQMLTFARRRDGEVEPLDVNALIAGLGELIKGTAGPLVRVRYDLAPALWPVQTDATQLEVALLNLISNARDAMPVGGAITCATRNVVAATTARPAILPDGDYVMLAVSDTGTGMSEAVRATAFEPFFTTKGSGRGTGLGLAIVYRFATQAGGIATIDSTPGHGSTVSLYLPRANRVAPDPAARSGEPDLPERLHVLIVDDEAPIRALLRELLTAHGHIAVAAEGGAEAIEILRSSEDIDVMLLDQTMPGLSGSETAAAARDLRPELPIIFMTGHVSLEAFLDWADRGAPILRKPFKAHDVFAVLASVRRAATEKG